MSDKTVTEVKVLGFPLVKFQSSGRIKEFQEGLVYMKNLSYYRELEKTSGNNVVGDSFEGSLHINEAKLIIPELGEEIDIVDGLIPTSYSNDFVFCMFGINPNFQSFQFTEEQKNSIIDFGNTALIITDKDEFFRRLFTAAERDKLKGSHGFVKYYDEHIDSINLLASLVNGMENIAFWKRDRYRYQQEYRFVVHNETSEDNIELNIGDISDISKIVKTSALLNPMAINHKQ